MMNESYEVAPVVMFVYNRADHFEKTYEALKHCEMAVKTDLYIFSDGAKNETVESQVRQVRKTLATIKDDKDFNKIEIIESEYNKGLAESIITGVTQIIEKYGKVIVLEDDCVASPYLLKFMNDALDYYEKDENIGSIAGFAPELNLLESYNQDVFFAYRSCSWGWATWKNRWDGVDWNLDNIKDFYMYPSLIKRLNANGSDRFIRLYRQTKGNGSSWSVRFGAHLVKNNQYTVYPRCSYIENVGCDESGVHSRSEDAEKMEVNLSKAIAEPKFEKLYLDEAIQEAMKKHYSGGVISDIKRAVGTVAIVIKERLWGKKA